MLPRKIVYLLAHYSIDLFKVLLSNRSFYTYYLKYKDQYLISLSKKKRTEYEEYCVLPNNIIHGQYRGYTIISNKDKTQKILSEEKHYYLGKLDGICKIYYLNSRVFSHVSYRRGKLDGRCIVYKKNGKVKIESLYSKNLLLASS